MKKLILFMVITIACCIAAQAQIGMRSKTQNDTIKRDDLGVPIKNSSIPDKIDYTIYATQDYNIKKETKTPLESIDQREVVLDIKNEILSVSNDKGINKSKILSYDFKGTKDEPVLQVFIDDEKYEYVLFYNSPKKICFWPRLQSEVAVVFLFSKTKEN